MKMYFASLIMAFFPFIVRAGQEVEAPKKVTVSASSHLFSSYVFDGTLVYNNPVLQSDVTIEFSNGLYANIWWSSDMDGNPSSSFGDEIDYTIGWAGSVWEIDIDTSFAYVDNHKLGHVVGDIFWFKLELSHNFELTDKHSLKPFVRGNYYFPVHGTEPERGWSFVAGLSHGWKVSEKLSISSMASVIHDDGVFAQDSGNILNIGSKIEFSITDHLSLDAGVDYFNPLSDFRDSRNIVGDQWVFSTGATYNF